MTIQIRHAYGQKPQVRPEAIVLPLGSDPHGKLSVIADPGLMRRWLKLHYSSKRQKLRGFSWVTRLVLGFATAGNTSLGVLEAVAKGAPYGHILAAWFTIPLGACFAYVSWRVDQLNDQHRQLYVEYKMATGEDPW